MGKLPPGYYRNDEIYGADTIEELCDKLVIIPLDGEPFLKTEMYVWNNVKEMFASDKIYGAIWTDEGLIYVAKMNEKGKLCLL